MQFLRLPSNAAAAACLFGSGREPLRRDFRSRHADPAGLLQSGDPQMAGWTTPQPSRCLAPRQSGSSPGCCQVVREVSQGSRRPSAVLGTPPSLHNQRHGARCLGAVHLPARCDTIATWHVGRGVPRPGRVSPTDAGLLQRARLPGLPGFPGKCRIATATPNCFDAPRSPWTSGWPRRGRHRTAPTWDSQYTHNQRITSAARLSALAAKGSAPRLAPRHYRFLGSGDCLRPNSYDRCPPPNG